MEQQRTETQILAACHAVCQMVDERQDAAIADDTKRIIQDSVMTYLNLCSMKTGGFQFYVMRPSTQTLEHVPHLTDRVSVLAGTTVEVHAPPVTGNDPMAEGPVA